jgi:HSP20 family protein
MPKQTERTQVQRKPITYPPFGGSTLANEVAQLRDQFDHMFSNIFATPAAFPMPLGWEPSIDVTEGIEELTVKAELPGVKKDDVSVTFDDGMLTIKGEKRDEKREKDEKQQYHVYERSYGAFARSFSLPSAIDDKRIKADFHDGVLTVHLPKSAEVKANGKPIEITG